ncbi:MAG: Mov34/MPN/PAD-1 family protein [Gammaproteobacteria bacterium]
MKILDHGQADLDRMVMPSLMQSEIKRYCSAEPNLERCGLIGGRGELALTFYPIANVAENPSHHFFLEPRAQLAAFKAMQKNREALLAIVHSHPNSPAEPSPTDAKMASYAGTIYLIVSLLGKEPTFACYLYENQAFSALPLEVIDIT